jgi:hypothetical protein
MPALVVSYVLTRGLNQNVPCWKYIEISSLRILDVIATMGVVSNWRIRWQAETPSRFGIIISINTRSYFEPAFILLTASNPSSCGLSI